VPLALRVVKEQILLFEEAAQKQDLISYGVLEVELVFSRYFSVRWSGRRRMM
jgi:hypothetical protein